jgi:two-component system chemotaxis response regulator CheY
VIDDSSLVRRQVTAALEGKGYDVVQAPDGPEALAILGAEAIALVITDFTMPKMSGIELIERVRAHPTCSNVPIIVLSTQTRVDLVERGVHLGVKAWLKKPFKAALLASAVESLM